MRRASETAPQKRRGSWISERASRSLFRARICGGITGTGAGLKNFFCSHFQVTIPAAINAKAPASHQTQAQLFGISTGGLIGRMSLVAWTAFGGTTRAPLLVIKGIEN